MDTVQIEDVDDEVKITLPVRRHGWLVGLFSITLLIWLAGLIVIGLSMFDEGRTAVLNCMVLIWLAFWGLIGKALWKQWQRYVSPREILYLTDATFILRRPVSIFGSTDAYDHNLMEPFIYDNARRAITFTYGSHLIPFAHTLPSNDAEQLVQKLNALYFPDWDMESDDE